MRTAVHSSDVEWFIIPTISLYDDNWGRQEHRWALFLYFGPWCLEIHF